MVFVILIVVGLTFGSFINALVWRIYLQDQGQSKKDLLDITKTLPSKHELSILRGRSMCPNCYHRLSFLDLLPVISWIYLRAKCRYCHRAISIQYPLVELITAGLFLASYLGWPYDFNTLGTINFVLWLIILVGLIALSVYDFKWFILPNKIILVLLIVAIIKLVINVVFSHRLDAALLGSIYGVAIGGGIFYVLFQVSKGQWIGGGDVKLGALLGLIVGGPINSLLVIFIASYIATIAILPLIILKRLKRSSHIPFGPFLITSTMIIVIIGPTIVNYLKSRYLLP